MRANRLDDELAAMPWPEMAPRHELVLQQDDNLIVCCGFEERCLSALRSATRSNPNPFSVLAVHYLPEVTDNRDKEIVKICAEAGLQRDVLIYDRHNPAGAGGAICDAVSDCTGRLYIDVSGMSRLLVVQIIVALADRYRSLDGVSIVYSEAQNYPPSENSVREAIKEQRPDDPYCGMFLSEGVINVVTVPELSSVALQGQPLRLICFPSFNRNQLSALRNELQPAYYTIVHGIPPADENRWRPKAIRALNRIDKLPHREEIEVSTFDYAETLRLLLQVYRTHGDIQRLAVVPTGSKMQAVAMGIFRTAMSDVRIAYPVSRRYVAPKEYTTGCRQTYELRLDEFSSLWNRDD